MDAKNMPAIHGKTSLFSVQSLPMWEVVFIPTAQRFIACVGEEGRQLHGFNVSVTKIAHGLQEFTIWGRCGEECATGAACSGAVANPRLAAGATLSSR